MFATVEASSGWWYPVVAIAVCNVLAAGAVVWYAWKTHRAPGLTPLEPRAPAPPPRSQFDAEAARELLQRLSELAASTAQDVGAHTAQMEKLTEQVSAFPSAGGDTLQASLLAAAAQMLEANQKLQEELAQTKAELHEHSKQIEIHMAEARVDALAGVANRRALDEELARRYAAWRREEKLLSFLIVDADHFKKFNDTYGHQAGDEVLRNIGRVLKANVRAMDFVARYGGEEFACVLPETRLEEAKAAAEGIRKAIAQNKASFGGKDLEVTVSVGVAELRVSDTIATLIEHADTALYAAKTNGRNCSYYYERGTCRAVDPAVAAQAEAAKAVRQQLVQAGPENFPSDRRTQPRHKFARIQRIAPYIAGRIPAADEFCDVQCRDLNSGGISFWLPSPPEFSSLVVALGADDTVKYLVAEVMRTAPVPSGDKTVYVVGCRFTGRLDQDSSPAHAAARG